MQKPTQTILQLIPADGWLAIFEESKPGEPIDLIDDRLISWALVEREYDDGRKWRGVVGVVSGDFGETALASSWEHSFVNYVHEKDRQILSEDLKHEAEIVKETREEDPDEA